jgi:hypothetical protein
MRCKLDVGQPGSRGEGQQGGDLLAATPTLTYAMPARVRRFT